MVFQKSIAAAAVLFSLVSAQVPNVQFSDMKGNSYDLYDLLSRGIPVLAEAMGNS